jgi:hypothetical protein
MTAGPGGAVGVETTTRHAFVGPRRLGSIRARDARRCFSGTGPFDPDRAPRTRRHLPVSPVRSVVPGRSRVVPAPIVRLPGMVTRAACSVTRRAG